MSFSKHIKQVKSQIIHFTYLQEITDIPSGRLPLDLLKDNGFNLKAIRTDINDLLMRSLTAVSQNPTADKRQFSL